MKVSRKAKWCLSLSFFLIQCFFVGCRKQKKKFLKYSLASFSAICLHSYQFFSNFCNLQLRLSTFFHGPFKTPISFYSKTTYYGNICLEHGLKREANRRITVLQNSIGDTHQCTRLYYSLFNSSEKQQHQNNHK